MPDSAEHVYGLRWQQNVQPWRAQGCLEAPNGEWICEHGACAGVAG